MEVNDFEIEVIWFFYIDLLVIEISFENIYIFLFFYTVKIFFYSQSQQNLELLTKSFLDFS